MSTNTPCSWYGVACSQGHVQGLELYGNQLSGAIPTELGNLANLAWLVLYSNQLTGAIPSHLGDLTNLQFLRLDRNQLSGAIPPQLGNLNHLHNLYLYSNQLSGAIPPELGNLAYLENLYLYGNQLTGTIPPELGNLTGLSFLVLMNNRLTGAIPPQLGDMARLNVLGLSGNQLSGTIPSQLSNPVYLRNLGLGKNQLTGTIPPQLGNLHYLMYLDLANNALEGEIPVELVNLTQLNTGGGTNSTDIGFNKLTASMPAVIVFLASKDPDWAQTQTVAPGGLQVTPKPVNSVELTWIPIPYAGDGGYYEIGGSMTPGGPYSIYGHTINKGASTYMVSNLQPCTTQLAVRTYTQAHGDQQNNLLSAWDIVTVDADRCVKAYLPLVLR